MSILTMSIIGVILLIILFFGIILNDSFYKNTKGSCLIISIVGLLILGIGGFGIYASQSKDKMIVEKVPVDTILKSKIKVYVELKDVSETFEFIDKKEFDEINDSTCFYRVTYYNKYNIDIKEIYSYNKIFMPFENKGKVESVEIENKDEKKR